MKNEIWKTIENFENYEVSSYGRVRNIKTGRILKPSIIGHGYLQIGLHNEDGCKQFLVHRLVAEAFIPNPENLDTVDHIIPDKTNNNAENLQWLSNADNIRKSQNIPVSQYYKNGEFIAVYVSAREASQQTGIDYSGIGKCCRGELHTAGGYIWRYENI